MKGKMMGAGAKSEKEDRDLIIERALAGHWKDTALYSMYSAEL